MDRIKPLMLVKLMEEQFKIQADKGLHKKDFFGFVGELVKQAVIVDKTHERNVDGKLVGRFQTGQSETNARVKHSRGREETADGKKEDEDFNPMPSKRRKLRCLACQGPHIVMECPDTPKEKAKEVLKKHREEIRQCKEHRGNNHIRNNLYGAAHRILYNHPRIFSALF